MIFTFFLVYIILWGCTEPFLPEIPPSDSLLVVDATITNELKNHEIFLSRSTQGEEEPKVESNATVRIVDDDQQQYPFTETEPGRYTSDAAFAPEPGIAYRLFVTLANGRSYTSRAVELPQTTQIDAVYSQRTNSSSGLDGVGIFVDSFDPTGNSIYYKYEFEETYRVVVPKWSPGEFVLVSENRVEVRQRTTDKRTCYATNISNSIILTKTTGITEDRVIGFNIRFLRKDNFIISHRYSILVRQYVLSKQAYDFYEKLREFSESESLFSESQPGFINGNILSEDNEDERVIGIFELSSVSEKRAFFNYTDFFPDSDLPPFIDECRQFVTTPAEVVPLVKADRVSFFNFVEGSPDYVAQPKICGDCTVFGPEEVPDFWEE
ncbi:DUF4249 domain-containing protein [Ulvibacterium sp.]|uniref:DUF4249 domain-containing protein n=1 Tax=Ulvibacterium sp. TaxID=2665914 RepID=UPI003BA89C1C